MDARPATTANTRPPTGESELRKLVFGRRAAGSRHLAMMTMIAETYERMATFAEMREVKGTGRTSL